MSQGKAFRSGPWVRQPRSSTSESDTTHGNPDRVGIDARPAHTGSGGRRTTWVRGRGLDDLNGRLQQSLFGVWDFTGSTDGNFCDRVLSRDRITPSDAGESPGERVFVRTRWARSPFFCLD